MPGASPAARASRLFATPQAAAQAGFRACRRCQPDLAQPPDPQLPLVTQITAAITARVQADGQTPTLADLGAQFALSPAHLQRVFKRVMGVSPCHYAASVRLEQFKQQLATQPTQSIAAAGYAAGYGSSSRLYAQANAGLGMSPSSYRAGGTQQGVAIMIDYTVLESTVGWVLLAATERGLCAVQLGDTATQLVDSLHVEYPQATISRADDRLAAWADAVLAHLAGHTPAPELPLDVQATAFQGLVWQALRAIPYGETRSYQEVAQRIGKPSASRAVARACASNQVAVLIPCHRVVRGDGTLGGYRWGVQRKHALLEREREAAANRPSPSSDPACL